jgi:serine/threonine protein kinase
VLSSAIKNYKFDKLVAEGTFSRVYQARDSKNNTVAIKAFPKYWID